MCDDTTIRRILRAPICSIVQFFEQHCFCPWDETTFFCNLQKIGVDSKTLKIFSVKSSYMHKKTPHKLLAYANDSPK